MTRLLAFAALLIPAATPLAAAPGGKLGTLQQGVYTCSTPGDAAGEAWHVIPDGGFSIHTASTYRTSTGKGTYLMTGDDVVFTRGPLKGLRFVRSGSSMLREVDKDGAPGRTRCVREGR